MASNRQASRLHAASCTCRIPPEGPSPTLPMQHGKAYVDCTTQFKQFKLTSGAAGEEAEVAQHGSVVGAARVNRLHC